MYYIFSAKTRPTFNISRKEIFQDTHKINLNTKKSLTPKVSLYNFHKTFLRYDITMALKIGCRNYYKNFKIPILPAQFQWDVCASFAGFVLYENDNSNLFRQMSCLRPPLVFCYSKNSWNKMADNSVFSALWMDRWIAEVKCLCI